MVSGKTRVMFDTGTASVAVARMNPALGRVEYWDGAAWAFGDTPTFHALTVSAGDSKLATKTFSTADTASWSFDNLFLVGYVEFGGTPYLGTGFEEVTDSANAHDGNEFDAVGLFK